MWCEEFHLRQSQTLRWERDISCTKRGAETTSKKWHLYQLSTQRTRDAARFLTVQMAFNGGLSTQHSTNNPLLASGLPELVGLGPEVAGRSLNAAANLVVFWYLALHNFVWLDLAFLVKSPKISGFRTMHIARTNAYKSCKPQRKGEGWDGLAHIKLCCSLSGLRQGARVDRQRA